MPPLTNPERYWSSSPDQILASLGSSVSGLTDTEADSRVARDGENRIEAS